MSTHIITWQAPSGKIVTSRPLTPAAARAEIEQNQQHTPDWRYTVEPPLPDLQAMLDAANARIVELEEILAEIRTHDLTYHYYEADEKVCIFCESMTRFEVHDANCIMVRLLDILPQKA